MSKSQAKTAIYSQRLSLVLEEPKNNKLKRFLQYDCASEPKDCIQQVLIGRESAKLDSYFLPAAVVVDLSNAFISRPSCDLIYTGLGSCL